MVKLKREKSYVWSKEEDTYISNMYIDVFVVKKEKISVDDFISKYLDSLSYIDRASIVYKMGQLKGILKDLEVKTAPVKTTPIYNCSNQLYNIVTDVLLSKCGCNYLKTLKRNDMRI